MHTIFTQRLVLDGKTSILVSGELNNFFDCAITNSMQFKWMHAHLCITPHKRAAYTEMLFECSYKKQGF